MVAGGPLLGTTFWRRALGRTRLPCRSADPAEPLSKYQTVYTPFATYLCTLDLDTRVGCLAAGADCNYSSSEPFHTEIVDDDRPTLATFPGGCCGLPSHTRSSDGPPTRS